MKRICTLIAAAILILALGVWHGFHIDKLRAFSKANNGPIEFYGRVLDQDGRPLEGVTVPYEVGSIPFIPIPWGPDNVSKGSTVTDHAGSFSVRGKRGCYLGIDFMSKAGFREPGYRNAGFRYEPGSAASHHPDPAKPVEFTLIRDDLPRAERVYGKQLSFVWNAGQVTVYCGPEVGSLVLAPIRNGINRANTLQSFDWSVDVSATGFGMALLSDETAKVAPTDGYQPGHKYDYPRDAKNWQSRVERKYAIRKADGTYGLMELLIFGDGDDKGVCGSVTIYLNKSGARNIDHK